MVAFFLFLFVIRLELLLPCEVDPCFGLVLICFRRCFLVLGCIRVCIHVEVLRVPFIRLCPVLSQGSYCFVEKVNWECETNTCTFSHFGPIRPF